MRVRMMFLCVVLLTVSATIAGATDIGTQINAAITALPAGGGVVNSCGMTGSTTFPSTITINKPVTLQLCQYLTYGGSGSANSAVNITSSGVRITGALPGSGFAQSVSGPDLIRISSPVQDVTVDHLWLTGVSTSSCTSSSDNGVVSLAAAGVTTLRVFDNVMTNLCGNGVYLQKSSDISIHDNTMPNLNGSGVRLSGVQQVNVSHNNIGPTGLTPSTFNIAVIISSICTTCGLTQACVGCTNSSDLHFVANTIRSYPNSQGILLHDGTWVTIADNVIRDVLAGIALGVYSSSDTINNATITGNVLVGTTNSGVVVTGGEYGIDVVGSSSTNKAAKVSITGNNIAGFNAISPNAAWGGILASQADNVDISSNVVYSNSCNGISLAQNLTRVSVRNNNVMDTVSCGGAYGIRVPSGQASSSITGSIASNTENNLTVCNEFDSFEPGILFNQNTNDCTSGTLIGGSGNVTLK